MSTSEAEIFKLVVDFIALFIGDHVNLCTLYRMNMCLFNAHYTLTENSLEHSDGSNN